MKKIRNHNMIKKILGTTLAACISVGSVLSAMPAIRVYASEDVETANAISAVGVDMAIGAGGLRDPIKRTEASGDMYVPSDYIYFGNNNRGAMLWRVLSADTDNMGNDGYVFAMSEYLEAASKPGKDYDEAYLPYFNDSEKGALSPSAENTSSADLYGNSWTSAPYDGLLFTPSVGDINKYVASYSGASTLRAYTDASRSISGSWWLRSETSGGNGYVGVSGNVEVEANKDSVQHYNRLAANLDLTNVIFSTRVDGGWRLAFLDSEYADRTNFDFSAWITDIDGDSIEISYVNAMPTDTSDIIGEYVSAIITDADGNVKYYKQLTEVKENTTWGEYYAYFDDGRRVTPGPFYKFQGSATIDVSGVYDRSAGDKIYAFWEKAYDSVTLENNPTLSYESTTASKLIELCHHESDPAIPATCTTLTVCEICDMSYGDYNYTSLDSHVEVTTDDDGNVIGFGESKLVWTTVLGQYMAEDSAGNYYLKEGYIHKAYCPDCGMYLPLDENGGYTGATPCYSSTEKATCVHAVKCDDCGEMFTDPTMHSFDHNGICSNNAHFEKPDLENGMYQISNVGQLIWYADYVNSFVDGTEMAGAVLQDDIDFSVLASYPGFESYTWTPMGREYPFSGTFDGNGFEIRNLNVKINATGTKNNIAAFIAGGENSVIKNLGIVGANIVNLVEDSSAYSAVLMGYGTYDNTITNCYVKDCTVSGKQNVGGMVSYLMDADELKSCYAIDLTLTRDGETVYGWILNSLGAGAPSYCFGYGENAGVIGESGRYISMGANNVYGNNCYFLNETLQSDGAKNTEQFENGMVAYLLGEAFGQTIGTDAYPILGGEKVYQVSVCGGEGLNKYTYSNTDEITHVSDGNKVCGEQLTCRSCGEKFGDAVVHSYTKFDRETGFIWEDDYTGCVAQSSCEICGKNNPELIQATVNFNFNGGIRADYVATVYIGGKQYTSDVEWVIIKTIDEATGILPSSQKFTGEDYWADMLVTNTQMRGDEYEAYFLLDGEMVGPCARDVGVYDLYIVGKGRFDYQTYTYEDFFTIEKVAVEMNIFVSDRIIDGTADYYFEYTFSDGFDYSGVVYPYTEMHQLPSAEVGEYEISGIEICYYIEDDAKNLEITYNKSTKARILPRNYVEIINNGYETHYPYTGKPVPTPSADDFKADKGSLLSFVWFKDGTRMNSAPVNAGEYVLRVYGTATDEYIANYYDFDIVIEQIKLDLSLDSYENYEHIIRTDDNETKIWYVLEPGAIKDPYASGLIKVSGLDEGDTLESAGVKLVYWTYPGKGGQSLHNEFPTLPYNDGYLVEVGLAYTDSNSNYCWDDGCKEELYILIKPDSNAITPLEKTEEYDGEAKDIDLAIGLEKSDLTQKDSLSSSMENFTYSMTVKNVNDFENYYNGTVISEGEFRCYYPTAVYDPSLPASVNTAGTYYVLAKARYLSYGDPYVDTSETLMHARITVEFFDIDENSVDQIIDPGKYTVTVTTEFFDENGEIDESKTDIRTATVTVNPKPKTLWIIVKETDVDLDKGAPEYSNKDIVFIPGYTLSAGHTIADLTYKIDMGGFITISDWYIVDESGNDVSDEYIIESRIVAWHELNYQVNGYDKQYKFPYEWLTHAEGYHGMAHIYDNACDSTCNVVRCNASRDVEPHKGGKATCATQAICDVCGNEYGGYDKSAHTSDKKLYVQNQNNFGYHDLVMACCGTVISSEKHTVIKDATCHTLAECKYCGDIQGSYDYDNHTSEDMYYGQNPDDETMHNYMHACCDRVESMGTHTGGEATCTDKAVCDVCRLGYGKLDPKNHSSDSFAYTVTENSTVSHEVSRACCGLYYKTEQHSGGKATCTDRAKCEHCEAEYGEIDPETHASDGLTYSAATIGDLHYIYHACCGVKVGEGEHSGGAANCLEKAKCEHCGAEYGEIDPNVHKSQDFEYRVNGSDATMHDKFTACCGEFVATEAHKGGSAICTEKATCDGCGAKYGDVKDHTYDNACDTDCNECGTKRISGHVDSNKDSACDSCGAELSKKASASGGKEGGCKSAFGASSALVAMVALAGFAIAKKKKKS